MSSKPYLNLTAFRIEQGKATTDHAGRDLDEAEAWALGQLVKCLGWADCRTKAVDDAEAHLMQEALAKLQRVLDEADISPR
ncbi:TPA: hypothetical protein ACRNLW_002117 [Pseudomonas aeruginosa]|uniref:DUF7706 family protein n=1 Tax=Pseudomonas aeruginosa TaxID=287 RepID=UPI000A5A0FF2|nr:hypothetical protein [Pseudomonas aeruginosa]MBH8731522.1 hypothetical protein [Pseudomonas aeruginosa]MCS8383189.1 hypothetical protein [Pseudomonas aeruginosa]MCS8456797.1 hypothetical protein [Pseudomonas aeruginosa]MCS9277114.1 hypothetical protein [Pseudomonas aeruginosa]MCS9592684.1 hypothetical protein [Pseudomonas aeruginosa]